MNILLLSTGGGGGNILRSVKTLFQRDVGVTRKTDEEYAERLNAAVTTRFLDTNAFSLADIPEEERVVIGSRLGARHNPDVAREALEESRAEVAALMAPYPVIVLIGTGGKGTGAGTMFPLAQMARQQKKLVVPIFVRPSFERHEVDKRRYDHALKVSAQLEAAGIRFLEILNDRGYDHTAPKSQFAVWEEMNRPIARALRGLIYVLWDLSQVDPSDLSTLFAGYGRLRIGFGEIELDEGAEPATEQVDAAVRQCWDNPYYAFTRAAGTSLICIQGTWSNIADAEIKSRLARLATPTGSESLYNPLYTRAARSPHPWGVTALFSEYTGVHPPLAIDWGFETSTPLDLHEPMAVLEPVSDCTQLQKVGETCDLTEPQPGFASFLEFARAVNRKDPAALALAGDGAMSALSVDGADVKRLLATFWFRSLVPRLSEEWRTRILEALLTSGGIPDHLVRIGRHTRHLSRLSHDQLRTVMGNFPYRFRANRCGISRSPSGGCGVRTRLADSVLQKHQTYLNRRCLGVFLHAFRS